MPQLTSTHPQVSYWLEHVRALSVDIGPRGSTREGERKGAEYAQAQFQKIGLKPIWETFQSVLEFPSLPPRSALWVVSFVFKKGFCSGLTDNRHLA